MTEMSVELKGFAEFLTKLRRLESGVRDKVIAKTLQATGNQIEALVKVRITDEGLVDTGFMRSSVYVSTHDQSGYGAARANASSRNPDAEMFPEARPKDAYEALVVVGANYAAYVENDHPFFRPVIDENREELIQLAADTAGRVIMELVK